MADRMSNPLTIESAGRRHYLCGDTYAIKDKIKAAGFKWDPDRRCWWTGQREKAEAFLPKAEKAAEKVSSEKADFRNEMDRRRAGGLSLSGTACKADEAKRHGGVWDRQLEVWLFPSREAMKGCTDDAAKRRGARQPVPSPRTPAKPKSERSGSWDEVSLVGDKTDVTVVTVERGGGRGYKPRVDDLVGQTRMIKHRGESVPMTTSGVEAYYVRGEDAEDQGDYGGSGWRIVEYMRPATDQEATPVVDARAQKQRLQDLRRELDKLVRSPETFAGDPKTRQMTVPWPSGKIVGGHTAGLAGRSGYIVGPDFVSWVESSYDDGPYHWQTKDPRAVEIAQELFGVTTSEDNPRMRRLARYIANGGR